MVIVGCGEAVLRSLSSGPRSPIPVNTHRHVERLGPRNPPARAGTFRGLFLVITVADGMERVLLVMGRDGLTGTASRTLRSTHHRHVERHGPRDPPARDGTFRGLFLVITVADGSDREMFVMVHDGLTGTASRNLRSTHHRHDERHGPRDPPARDGTFSGLCL
jgi:hypothetical protein